MLRLRVSLVAILGAILSSASIRPGFCQDPFTTGACGTVKQTNSRTNSSAPLTVSHWGGRCITSTGTLRVLVVFVRFPDDNETSTYWPNPAVLPSWAASFVDPDYRSNGAYTPGSASHWFWENSYGLFHVIGDVKYVTLSQNESYYHGLGNPRGSIETEVFNALDAPPYNVNFMNYDNWTFSPFSHHTGADGFLDMCWVMTRNLHDELYPGQGFGIGWAMLDCPTMSKDGVTIKNGYDDAGTPAGSGVGGFGKLFAVTPSNLQATNGQYTNLNFIAHEMSHYLFGYDHFAKYETMDAFALASSRSLSDMAHYVGGWAGHFSGYEKWRLQWLSPTNVSSDTYITLYDQATTRDPLRTRLIKINIPSTSQYFLVENRRFLSPYEARYPHWETGNPPTLSPGVLVYQILDDNEYLTHAQVKVLTSDGKWNWNMLSYGGNTNVQCDDIYTKGTPNSVGGYDENEWIYISGYTGQRWQAIYWANDPGCIGGYQFPTNFQTLGVSAGDAHGDKYDLFNVGDVITPYSNPGSHKWVTSPPSFVATTIGIEFDTFDPVSQAYGVRIRLANPLADLRPSRPQYLRLSVVGPIGDLHPKLTWIANTETDMASYKIYRAMGIGGTYVNMATVSHPTAYWVDYSIKPGNYDTAYYKITAIDNTSKESSFSDAVWIRSNMQRKIEAGPGEIVVSPLPEVFGLGQSYPNPFNPTTKIEYQLPTDVEFSLTVLDILGREVATLANGYRAAGVYSVVWDGSSVASGVYYVRMVARDGLGTVKFMKVNKVVLAK